MKLGVICDGISRDLTRAIDVMDEFDLTYAELQFVGDKEVGDHSAAEIAEMDQQLDEHYQMSIRHLITFMLEDPRTISASLDLLFVAKAIERIGDHSKNIAEFREAKVAKESISYGYNKKDTQEYHGGNEKCLCFAHKMMSLQEFSQASRFFSISAGSTVSGFFGTTANSVNKSGKVAFLLTGNTNRDSGIDS